MSSGAHRWVLSGGLASGKSKVREILALSGIMTIDADAVGHRVIESDGPAFAKVASRWPQVVEHGEVNRSALAAIVFNDQRELTVLESISHPYIFDTIRSQVEEVDGPVVVEIPLLTHGLGEDWKRMVVDCRDDIRLQRAVGRGMSQHDARARMSAQPHRIEWLASADVVVPNHHDLEQLEEATERFAAAIRD